MRRKTKLANGLVVETYSLSESQHEAAVMAAEEDLRRVYGYEVAEVEDEMVDIWLEDAKKEDDMEYVEFLRTAIDNNAEVLTLNDSIGDFTQTIGEIIIY